MPQEGSFVYITVVSISSARHPGWVRRDWKIALRAITLCLCAGLGGCISLAPPHVRPPLAVPDTFDGFGAQAPAAPAAGMAWHDYFVDERLRVLIAQALARNHDVRVAVLRVAEARALHGIQRADSLPTIGVAFDATRARVPGDLNASGQSVVGNQMQFGVGFASWELDLWGRLRNLNEAALESYLGTEAAQRAVMLSVVAQVANGYLGLRELDERLVLARRTAASREASSRIFRRRFELGAASKLELTQVEVLSLQASALVTQLEQARAVESHAMTLLVDGAADLSPWAEPLNSGALFVALAPGVPSELLLNRPDIEAAEHALKAANASIGAARAYLFPRIELTGALGTASADLDALFHPQAYSWNLAPSVSLPLFDHGRNAAAVELSKVQRDQAAVRYEQTVHTAFRDVADALSARQWLGEQVDTMRATLAVQTERARLARLRYDSGAARYLEVLDAERDGLAAGQQLVQTQRAWLAAQVTLYAALGGGSKRLAADATLAGTPRPSRTNRPARTP
jgi:multidrug efflux system outer membrane protein